MVDPWAELLPMYEAMGVTKSAMALDGYYQAGSYPTEHLKILFVLKEPHEQEGVDMRDQLKKGAEKMWLALARWAAGILGRFPPYREVDTTLVKNAALKRVAVINLKKVAGGKRSDPEVIHAYAHAHRVVLRRQIAILAPHLIIACGTTGPLRWLLDLDLDPSPTDGTFVASSYDGCVVVPWRHPAMGAGQNLYDKLASRMRPILAKVRLD
jgi:hypothetical protein